MGIQTLAVIYLGVLQAAWLLVPMIPAILIFRLFHDTAVNITGPVLGFTVSASGAFAGYVLIVLLSQSWAQSSQAIVRSWMPPPQWQVKAEIKLFESNGQELPHPDLMPKITMFASSPDWYTVNQYTQTATINVVEDKGILPKIIIFVPGYGSNIIEPDTLAANKTDFVNKLIFIKSVVFKKDYSPTTSHAAPGEPLGAAQ